MFTVTNTSDETKRFNEADPQGGFRLIRLAPGEGGEFDIDPNQAVFVRGGLDVAPASPAEPAPEPAPKRGRPAKTESEIAAPEPETNATGPSGASEAE